eukprot:755962-Hanusia_phi.AAC.1
MRWEVGTGCQGGERSLKEQLLPDLEDELLVLDRVNGQGNIVTSEERRYWACEAGQGTRAVVKMLKNEDGVCTLSMDLLTRLHALRL